MLHIRANNLIAPLTSQNFEQKFRVSVGEAGLLTMEIHQSERKRPERPAATDWSHTSYGLIPYLLSM